MRKNKIVLKTKKKVVEVLKHGLQDQLFRMINYVNGECPGRLVSRPSA